MNKYTQIATKPEFGIDWGAGAIRDAGLTLFTHSGRASYTEASLNGT
jgi:hypothetical protein